MERDVDDRHPDERRYEERNRDDEEEVRVVR